MRRAPAQAAGATAARSRPGCSIRRISNVTESISEERSKPDVPGADLMADPVHDADQGERRRRGVTRYGTACADGPAQAAAHPHGGGCGPAALLVRDAARHAERLDHRGPRLRDRHQVNHQVPQRDEPGRVHGHGPDLGRDDLQLVDEPAQQAVEHVVLATEVSIERGARRSGGPADVLDPGVLEPHAAEHGQSRREQPIAGRLDVTVGAAAPRLGSIASVDHRTTLPPGPPGPAGWRRRHG